MKDSFEAFYWECCLLISLSSQRCVLRDGQERSVRQPKTGAEKIDFVSRRRETGSRDEVIEVATIFPACRTAQRACESWRCDRRKRCTCT